MSYITIVKLTGGREYRSPRVSSESVAKGMLRTILETNKYAKRGKVVFSNKEPQN